MIVILGLVILVAAVIVGVAGVLATAAAPMRSPTFAVFGYHVTGSTGTLFLYGIVVGALALVGLSLLLAGARRTSRRGRAARRGLQQSRRETAAVSQDRDDLIGQRDTARAYTASTLGNGDASRQRPRSGRDGSAGQAAPVRAPARSPAGGRAAARPGRRPASPPPMTPARSRPRPRNDSTKDSPS